MYVVLVVNGIFGNVVFIETVYTLLQAWVEKNFMQNSNFLRIHLKPTPNKSHQVTQVTPDKSRKSHLISHTKSRKTVLFLTAHPTVKLVRLNMNNNSVSFPS